MASATGKVELDFTGSHPEDAALYEKMPPPQEGEILEEEDEWLDILGSGRLKKKVLVKGQEDSRPDYGWEVFVHYKVSLDGDDRILFDSKTAEGGEPIAFRVGENDVVAALDLVMALMNEGETALVYTDAVYAYGAQGQYAKFCVCEPWGVPPNASLVYEIEYVKAGREPVDLDETSPEERLALALQKKERGNWLFKRKDFDGAVKSYNMGLAIVKHKVDGEDASKHGDALRHAHVTLLNNLCQTLISYGAYEKAKRTCEEALALDPQNLKALYRMGAIHNHFQDFSDAKSVLKKALAIEPADSAIAKELKKAADGITKQNEKEKQLAEAMLSGYKSEQVPEVPERHATGDAHSAQAPASQQYLMLLLAIIVVIAAIYVASLVAEQQPHA